MKKLSILLIIHLFLSLSLVTLAFYYTAVITAASLCSGWNEGTMSVTACSVGGIEGLADTGYALGLFSSFFFGAPFLLPGIVSFLYFKYWYKEKKAYVGDKIYGYIASTGVVASCFALVIFIGVPIAFILSFFVL